MTALPALMVAPNGARHTKADHPMVPITLEESIADAKACFQAGADGLHLHLRDKNAKHLLDAGLYREAVQELGRVVPDMAIQITTEAVGAYAPATQMQVALASNATLVSASIREITHRQDCGQTSRFYQQAAEQGIFIQHILYDITDLLLLQKTLPKHLYENKDLQLLFVLGKYGQPNSSSPGLLDVFLDQMRRDAITPDWGICAFGYAETQCMVYAKQNGGKMRVGYENSFWHADKSLSKNNADRVSAVCRAIRVSEEAEPGAEPGG